MEQQALDQQQQPEKRNVLQMIWAVARPILGWVLLIGGIAGCVLPVLPGIPMIMLGIALVGRRTWLVRWASVHYKLLVRWWAERPQPWLAYWGRIALRVQQEASRQRRRLAIWQRNRRTANGFSASS
jgi:hypothetical protein